ncbi:MAG: heavy-metal-associated domain-containing protein [Muribaculaceae bacterium]|nr:heavy-metal-associated domain-containing protein [Muribaculaceae bacterium]
MMKFKVTGMHCEHCKATVEAALAKLPGAQGIHVNLERGRVKIESVDVDASVVIQTIKDLGFDAEEHVCACGGKCGCGGHGHHHDHEHHHKDGHCCCGSK